MKRAIALVTAIFTILIMNFIESRAADHNADAVTPPPPTPTPSAVNQVPITPDNTEDIVLQRLFSDDSDQLATFDVKNDIAIAYQHTVQISPLHDTLQMPVSYSTIEGYSILALRLMPDDSVRMVVQGPHSVYLGTANYLQRLNTSAVTTASFNQDGSRLATGDANGTVVIWKTDSGIPITTIATAHQSSVTAVVFNDDGSLVATGGADHAVKVWETNTGRAHTTLERPTETVVDLAFSADSQNLAAASKEVWVWNIESGDVILQLPYRVQCVAFSPNTTILATGGTSVRLWDIATGQLLTELDETQQHIAELGFSTDGTALLSADQLGLIFHWAIEA